ncbi:MAG: cytochrome P450 [Polyangiaceae bacterium]
MTDYLAEFDKAAENQRFALVRSWIDRETLPFFKQLREQRPVLVTPECTLVARHADVVDLLRQPTVFTTALYLPKQANGKYLMSHDDDALHTREKGLMQGFLNRDDLPKVRAGVASICSEILERANGKMEAAYGYCRAVPAGIVQNYFGLTGVSREKLIEWSYWAQYDTFHNQPFDARTDDERKHIIAEHDRTAEEMSKYVIELVAHRLLMVKLGAPFHWLVRLATQLFGGKEALSDDIAGRLLRSGFPAEIGFDIERIGVNIAGLLIGAVETTARAVAQVAQYLLSRPEWTRRAAETARLPDPARFDGIVWEALRFVSPFPYTFRECATDYVVGRGTSHATPISPGTYVLCLTQSAMFDEAVFDAPDDFIPSRNFYGYFHFGFGSHECLGKYVGLVMIPEMLRNLFRCAELKPTAPIDYKSGPFPEKYELTWNP